MNGNAQQGTDPQEDLPTLLASRHQRCTAAVRLLEPLIEITLEDEPPLELIGSLCEIILGAMASAPDGHAWSLLWAKYVRWESIRSEWEAHCG